MNYVYLYWTGWPLLFFFKRGGSQFHCNQLKWKLNNESLFPLQSKVSDDIQRHDRPRFSNQTLLPIDQNKILKLVGVELASRTMAGCDWRKYGQILKMMLEGAGLPAFNIPEEVFAIIMSEDGTQDTRHQNDATGGIRCPADTC